LVLSRFDKNHLAHVTFSLYNKAKEVVG